MSDMRCLMALAASGTLILFLLTSCASTQLQSVGSMDSVSALSLVAPQIKINQQQYSGALERQEKAEASTRTAIETSVLEVLSAKGYEISALPLSLQDPNEDDRYLVTKFLQDVASSKSHEGEYIYSAGELATRTSVDNLVFVGYEEIRRHSTDTARRLLSQGWIGFLMSQSRTKGSYGVIVEAVVVDGLSGKILWSGVARGTGPVGLVDRLLDSFPVRK